VATNPPEKIVFRVVAASLVPSRDPERAGKRDYLILVQAPDGTTLTITIPEEEFSNIELVKAKIREEYEKIRALKSTPLEITF